MAIHVEYRQDGQPRVCLVHRLQSDTSIIVSTLANLATVPAGTMLTDFEIVSEADGSRERAEGLLPLPATRRRLGRVRVASCGLHGNGLLNVVELETVGEQVAGG